MNVSKSVQIMLNIHVIGHTDAIYFCHQSTKRKGRMHFLSLKRSGEKVKKSININSRSLQKPRSKAQLTHEMSIDSLSNKLPRDDMKITSDLLYQCKQNEKFDESKGTVTKLEPKKNHRRKYVGSFAADAYEAARFDAELGGSSEVGIRFTYDNE